MQQEVAVPQLHQQTLLHLLDDVVIGVGRVEWGRGEWGRAGSDKVVSVLVRMTCDNMLFPPLPPKAFLS